MTGFFIFLSCVVLGVAACLIVHMITKAQIDIKTKIEQRELTAMHKQFVSEIETLFLNHKNWVSKNEELQTAQLDQTKEQLLAFRAYVKEAQEVLAAYKMTSKIR